MRFEPCKNTGFYLRMGLVGPAGSGKTFTALRIATEFGAEKIGVIDTEGRSARRYAATFRKQFYSLELDHFSPSAYIEAIGVAQQTGIEFLVIDSLSHAWMGKGGVLEMADQAAKRSKSGNSFNAWREVTPEHNRLMDTILRAPMHIIVTLRTKTEYVIDQNEKGRSVPRKVGLAPVQREGLEYEFDIVGELTADHELMISKTRCPELTGEVLKEPGVELAKTLYEWVNPSNANGASSVESHAAKQNNCDTALFLIETTASMEDLRTVGKRLHAEKEQGAFTEAELEKIRHAIEAAKKRLGGAA